MQVQHRLSEMGNELRGFLGEMARAEAADMRVTAARCGAVRDEVNALFWSVLAESTDRMADDLGVPA